MSQATTWSVPQTGPATPTEYAQRDNASFNALLSCHSGSSRPSYAVAGTLWLKTIDASESQVYFYDGTSDIYFGKLDLTNHYFLPVINGTALSELTNSPVYLGNSNGNPNVSDTLFEADVYVTENTWESVGPTGAGADNTWTAMDSIPSGVDWIRIYGIAYGTNGAASTNLYITAYVRETGGSQSVGDDNIILKASGRSDASGYANLSDSSEVTIPVDSNLCFDIYWSGVATSENVNIRLVGYGYNY